MKRSHLLTLLLGVVLSCAGRAAADDLFWVQLGTETFVVGQITFDGDGAPWVSAAWLYTDSELIPIPGCDGSALRGASRNGESLNEPRRRPPGYCSMFQVIDASSNQEERLLLVAVPPNTYSTEATGPPSGTNGNSTSPGGPNFEGFATLLIPDGYGDWGSFLFLPLFLIDPPMPAGDPGVLHGNLPETGCEDDADPLECPVCIPLFIGEGQQVICADACGYPAITIHHKTDGSDYCFSAAAIPDSCAPYCGGGDDGPSILPIPALGDFVNLPTTADTQPIPGDGG